MCRGKMSDEWLHGWVGLKGRGPYVDTAGFRFYQCPFCETNNKFGGNIMPQFVFLRTTRCKYESHGCEPKDFLSDL